MRISAIRELFNPELKKAEGIKKTDGQKTKAPVTGDRTEFSSNAQRLSETKAQVQTISAQLAGQPDVRPEKIAEAKQRIKDGYYDKPEFIDKLADKLAQEFGVKKPSA
jgi:flagellar biosynthesis anti-sigma factor FlgM